METANERAAKAKTLTLGRKRVSEAFRCRNERAPPGSEITVEVSPCAGTLDLQLVPGSDDVSADRAG